MATINQIKMEYQQVERQVKKLEGCADDLQRINRQLKDLMSNLSGSWEGESASAFLSKCQALSDKIKRSGNDIDKTAGVIRRTAKAYRDAEIRSIELAKD